MHGSGKFSFASGASYEGQWDNGIYHGSGTFSWPDGRWYQVGPEVCTGCRAPVDVLVGLQHSFDCPLQITPAGSLRTGSWC